MSNTLEIKLTDEQRKAMEMAHAAQAEHDRSVLIQELRHALHLAESPSEKVVEFEIHDVAYCFEF